MRMAAISDERYPAISDLRKKAAKRSPFFAFEYLDSGTGSEVAKKKNEEALAAIKLVPRFLKGELQPNLEKSLFGRTYSVPFGVAPVGMSSLMWPGAEQFLAKMAREKNIPYCLSTVAADSIEAVGQTVGANGWFQLYCPRDKNVRDDMLDRAAKAGFSSLVVTVDVPAPSTRERQRRAGLTMPPVMDAKTIYRVLMRPRWAIETLRRGSPKFLSLEKYASTNEMRKLVQFVGAQLGGTLDWEYLREIRKVWKGPIVVKGILSPEDALKAIKEGIDGVWVSNHGGRQFDGAPASIECLPDVVDAIGGKAPVLFDSGVRGGLDIIRALRLGADFVFAGRPFLYGVCAMGEKGAQHTYELLSNDLLNNMIQIGCSSFAEIKNTKIHIKNYIFDEL